MEAEKRTGLGEKNVCWEPMRTCLGELSVEHGFAQKALTDAKSKQMTPEFIR